MALKERKEHQTHLQKEEMVRASVEMSANLVEILQTITQTAQCAESLTATQLGALSYAYLDLASIIASTAEVTCRIKTILDAS